MADATVKITRWDLPPRERERLKSRPAPRPAHKLDGLVDVAMAVAREVEDETCVPFAAIIGRSRVAAVVRARHKVWSRLRYERGWSLELIGGIFHVDHTTVLHATRREPVRVRVAVDGDGVP